METPPECGTFLPSLGFFSNEGFALDHQIIQQISFIQEWLVVLRIRPAAPVEPLFDKRASLVRELNRMTIASAPGELADHGNLVLPDVGALHAETVHRLLAAGSLVQLKCAVFMTQT